MGRCCLVIEIYYLEIVLSSVSIVGFLEIIFEVELLADFLEHFEVCLVFDVLASDLALAGNQGISLVFFDDGWAAWLCIKLTNGGHAGACF